MLDAIDTIFRGASGLVVLIGLVGGSIAWLGAMHQFYFAKRLESKQREFDNFHKIIEWMVKPNPETQTTEKQTDQQVAAVYELRDFTGY